MQREIGGVIITMSNVLLDQYIGTYPEIPALKGKHSYSCSKTQTCGDTIELDSKPCEGCPYVAGRRQVRRGLPAISNPAAYFYASRGENFQFPDVLIIDEAHSLYDFACTLGESTMRLPTGIELDTQNIVAAVELIEAHVATLKTRTEIETQVKVRIKIARQMERLRQTALFLKIDPEAFYLSVEKKAGPRGYVSTLTVRSVTPSKAILKTFMSAKKVVLLSATIFKKDVEKLVGKRTWALYQGDPAIPPTQRPIYIDPVDAKVNRLTPPKQIADWIKAWRRKYPDRNTIAHVTYDWAARLRPFFLPEEAIVNTKEDKALCIKKFKKQGGLFIAAGCAEGVDFPYDEARLNLIPIMYKANLGDEGVQRRRAAPGGHEEYDLDSLRTTIQQAGRSTRAPDDESVIVIGDPVFAWKVQQYRRHMPKGFYESIQWGKKI